MVHKMFGSIGFCSLTKPKVLVQQVLVQQVLVQQVLVLQPFLKRYVVQGCLERNNRLHLPLHDGNYGMPEMLL
jgi:hypothetical protein